DQCARHRLASRRIRGGGPRVHRSRSEPRHLVCHHPGQRQGHRGPALQSTRRQRCAVEREPLRAGAGIRPGALCGAIFAEHARGLWTPDEPREADIAWRMSRQSDRTLPQLAGTPFLEKPPLSYWMSGAAISLFGDSAAAERAPNLLYAAVTAVAVGALALAMD